MPGHARWAAGPRAWFGLVPRLPDWALKRQAREPPPEAAWTSRQNGGGYFFFGFPAGFDFVPEAAGLRAGDTFDFVFETLPAAGFAAAFEAGALVLATDLGVDRDAGFGAALVAPFAAVLPAGFAAVLVFGAVAFAADRGAAFAGFRVALVAGFGTFFVTLFAAFAAFFARPAAAFATLLGADFPGFADFVPPVLLGDLAIVALPLFLSPVQVEHSFGELSIRRRRSQRKSRMLRIPAGSCLRLRTPRPPRASTPRPLAGGVS